MSTLDKRRIGVRAIIIQEDKILAVKHKSQNGEPSEFWSLPGGGLDPLESLEAGVIRELYEEFGRHAVVGQLLAVQQFASTRPDRDEELEFFFHVTNSADFVDIDLGTTSHGASELACVDFIDPRTEYILPEFLQKIDVAALTASAGTPIIKSYL